MMLRTQSLRLQIFYSFKLQSELQGRPACAQQAEARHHQLGCVPRRSTGRTAHSPGGRPASCPRIACFGCEFCLSSAGCRRQHPFAFDVGALFALSVVDLNPVFLQFGNRSLCHLDTWSSDVVDVWGPILSSMYQAFGLVRTF